MLSETSVASLAKKAGDNFVGLAMPVAIAPDTSSIEGTTFISKAQEQVRQNGCFLRFSDTFAVKAIALNSVPTWTFSELDIRAPINCTSSGKKRQPFLGEPFHPQLLGTVIPDTPYTQALGELLSPALETRRNFSV